MQTRHNFVREIRIFSVKIRINPYPSFMHRCIAKTFMPIHIVMQFAKESRHCVIKITASSKEPKSERYVTWRDSRIRTTPLIDLVNCAPPETKSPVFCSKSVSQGDTAVSSEKRPKSVLDTDNPYQVACLIM